MPAATVIVACLIGFRFYGVDGACIAGGVAWLSVGVLVFWISSVQDGRLLEAVSAIQSAADSADTIAAALPDALKDIRRDLETAQEQRADMIKWLRLSPMPSGSDEEIQEAIAAQAALMGLDPENYRKPPNGG